MRALPVLFRCYIVLAASWVPKPGLVELLSEAKAPDGSYITWKEHLLDSEDMGLVPIRARRVFRLADIDRDGSLTSSRRPGEQSHPSGVRTKKPRAKWFLLTPERDRRRGPCAMSP